MTATISAKGIVTAEIRKSDGASIARDLFATYPVRLHLTSRPNRDIARQYVREPEDKSKEENEILKKHKALCCYVLGYGGGLVSGDQIDLKFKVKSFASLVITSQSTSKAFKAVPNRAPTFVRTNANVNKGGLLVLVPQPTQCFAKAKFVQETNVSMQYTTKGQNPLNGNVGKNQSTHDSSLLLVDWYTGGRRNLDNGHWQLDYFSSTTSISYEEESSESSSSSLLAFRDYTQLSGGPDLLRHMRDFNIVCMVVLIGSRVRFASDYFLNTFASRHSFHDEHEAGNKKLDQECKTKQSSSRQVFSTQHYTRGEGLNGEDGVLISCGTFPIPSLLGNEQGVVLRIASTTIEQAALFLSKNIGTLKDQLEDDPFLEILVSRQTTLNPNLNSIPNSNAIDPETHNGFSFRLVKNSYQTKTDEVAQSGPMSNKISPVCLYQLVDASTPTGGFAHSNTVEVARQLHFIADSSVTRSIYTLQSHVWEVMLQSCTSLLPFLLSSCKIFQKYEPSENFNHLINEWMKLDSALSATLTSHVSRRASSAQGSGMLRAYIQTFPHISKPLKEIKKKVLQASAFNNNKLALFGVCGHAVTCFGAVCGLLGIDLKNSSSMFLYTVARDMINAAVRMNLAGPLEACGLINDICSRLDILLDKVLLHHRNDHTNVEVEPGVEIRTTHQICPLLEILANAHDRLYTRLFNS